MTRISDGVSGGLMTERESALDLTSSRPRSLALYISALVFLGGFYLVLALGITPFEAAVLYALISVLALRWPNESMLLLTPGLVPVADLDFGLGVGVFPMLVGAALIGQVLRGQWTRRALGDLGWWMIAGWFLLILGLILASIHNDMQLIPGILVWVVRAILMIEYASAWARVNKTDTGFWGWAILGLLVLPAALYAYRSTGDVLYIREQMGLLTQGSLLNVSTILLWSSGTAVVSFWGFLAIRSFGSGWGLGMMILAGSMAFPILFSGRRQAMLAALVAVLLWVLQTNAAARWKVLVLVIVVAYVVMDLGLVHQFVTGRESLVEEFRGEGTGRLEVYQAGWDAFLRSPLFGHGLGSYGTITEAAGVVDIFGRPLVSHNTVIGVAAEAGALGLLGLAVVLGNCFHRAARLFRLSRKRGVGPWSFGLAIFGFSIAGLLVSRVLESHQYLLPLGMVIGLAARYKIGRVAEADFAETGRAVPRCR